MKKNIYYVGLCAFLFFTNQAIQAMASGHTFSTKINNSHEVKDSNENYYDKANNLLTRAEHEQSFAPVMKELLEKQNKTTSAEINNTQTNREPSAPPSEEYTTNSGIQLAEPIKTTDINNTEYSIKKDGPVTTKNFTNGNKIETVTNKNGNVVRTSMISITGARTDINYTNQTVTVSRPPLGKSITYQADGSYTIQGDKTVYNTPQTRSSNNYFARDNKTASTITVIDNGLVEIVTTRQTKNIDGGRPYPISITKIATDGTVSNEQIDQNLVFQPKSSVRNLNNGSIIVEQKQPNDGPSTFITLNTDGTTYKKQEFTYGDNEYETIESYNNGPQITSTLNLNGTTESVIKNPDGSQTTIFQNNLTLTIQKSKGTNGLFYNAAGKGKTLSFDNYINALKKLTTNDPQAKGQVIDAMTLKLVDDPTIINSPEYKTFKNQIILELIPAQKSNSWTAWFISFFKKAKSIDIAKTKDSINYNQRTNDQINIQNAINTQNAVQKDSSLVLNSINESTMDVTNNLSDKDINIKTSLQSSDMTITINNKNQFTKTYDNLPEKTTADTQSSNPATMQLSNNLVTMSSENGTQIQINLETGTMLNISGKNLPAQRANRNVQKVTTDPVTGATTVITLQPDGVTPLSKLVRQLDGQSAFYKANNKGAFDQQPTSKIEINNDGTATTTVFKNNRSLKYQINNDGTISQNGNTIAAPAVKQQDTYAQAEIFVPGLTKDTIPSAPLADAYVIDANNQSSFAPVAASESYFAQPVNADNNYVIV